MITIGIIGIIVSFIGAVFTYDIKRQVIKHALMGAPVIYSDLSVRDYVCIFFVILGMISFGITIVGIFNLM